jgi:two-component system cell cycle response regulator DivK
MGRGAPLASSCPNPSQKILGERGQREVLAPPRGLLVAEKKILVIEDNLINLSLMQMTFENRGYLLLSATNGEDGLRLAAEERPDLIIADIQLPNMDGLEVIRTLRQTPQVANTPAIALTAYAMKGDKERILGAGYDAYIEKPFNIRELRRVVEDMLEVPPLREVT